jgi:hypothetical protein
MPNLFEDEKKYPDNRARENFVFLGYPYNPALPRDDYRAVVADIEKAFPLRLWYFLDEITTAEMMRKIWRAILRSDLAVFDTSGGNPNVAFELGLAVAQNRPTIILHKTGEPNPLGSADLGYAERAEYTSAATLKERLTKVLQAKSSALRRARELSYHIYDSNLPKTRDDLESAALKLLSTVYTTKRITKSQAEKEFGDRGLADRALNRLREVGVLQVEGARRGARWVFGDLWVYHDHEVAGA